MGSVKNKSAYCLTWSSIAVTDSEWKQGGEQKTSETCWHGDHDKQRQAHIRMHEIFVRCRSATAGNQDKSSTERRVGGVKSLVIIRKVPGRITRNKAYVLRCVFDAVLCHLSLFSWIGRMSRCDGRKTSRSIQTKRVGVKAKGFPLSGSKRVRHHPA